MKNLCIKRVYEDASKKDGVRILVDRLWPRGIKKEDAKLDHWLKELAPSNELRKWFGHDPEKWKEFRKRYFVEIDEHPEEIQTIRDSAKKKKTTLLFGAHDEEHNNAVALIDYLEK